MFLFFFLILLSPIYSPLAAVPQMHPFSLCPKNSHGVQGLWELQLFYWCRPVHSFCQLLALPMPRADPEQSSLQNAGCATSNTQLLQRLVESWYLVMGIENQKKTIQHKLHDGMAMSQMRWGRCLFLSKCQQGAINFILLVTHLHYGNLNELISVTSGLHYSQEYR